MTITPIYAGLVTLIFVFLSFRVIRFRRGEKISLGDGGNSKLLKRQRVHGNLAEYAPFSLLLLGMAELQDAPHWFLHGVGLALLAGRISHAIGLGSSPQIMKLRVAGVLLTMMSLIIGSLTNIGLALT